ncbi:MAG: arylsulfatase [Bryobacteraceae bacterium]
MMHRRRFLQSLSAAGLAAQAQSATQRPNILLILADDLGYGDLGCYGQTRIRTPHIDRLAAEGTRFTSAYAGSTVCAPSRCALMTGFHTGHGRVRGNHEPDLPLQPGDPSVSKLLKNAGYRTGLFGKWSLGQLGSTGYPTKQGFDEWFGYFSQVHAHNYYPEHLLSNDTDYFMKGNLGTQHKDYAPDMFTARAVDFLKQQSAAQPFFLHVSYTTPHANNEMGRDTGNGMQVPSDAPYSGESWPQVEKNFAAMVTRMDSDVGKLLDTLRAKQLAGNTLVIFTSDNGPHAEGGHKPDFFGSRGGLRGIKRDLYEGGIRVPTIARWPGQTPAGKTSDFAWAFWDFLPTAAELAGAPVPPNLDGISIAPTLLGKNQKPHDHLYWEFHEKVFHQAVRAGNWKAVRKGLAVPIELYDLATDPAEQHDVSAQQPAVVERMRGILANARTESADFPVRRA